MIARGSGDSKNLTRAAKIGGVGGDLLFESASARSRIDFGVAKLAFVIDGGDFFAVPDEKPAVVPLKFLDGRLHLVAHDVDLPAGTDAQNARRARFVAGRSAGLGDV